MLSFLLQATRKAINPPLAKAQRFKFSKTFYDYSNSHISEGCYRIEGLDSSMEIQVVLSDRFTGYFSKSSKGLEWLRRQTV
ncbi:MAG: hypothetical protein GY699_09310 [Desulfobacteraceae bacterium]|nr:hypothetical protein [Desulfobacteraceae bacterium]